MDEDLVVRCQHVELGEDGTPENLVGVIVDMTVGVTNMSCVCRDNNLLHWSIDIYCSRTLYAVELE
jgi:hypothetical protein